ncbi:hypothetical protein HJG43_12385 [Kineosporiaceae bacterium SCSIO 59966]|nr:hypothetical protein HJG43_12385 [Kineosporiaceae bacterium SCSIO 59966]
MRGARTTAGLGLAVLVVLGAPVVAAADTPSVDGVSVRTDDGQVTTAVRISDLYPTATRQAVILLDGPEPERVRRMSLGVEDLLDHENGCNRPETNTGDDSCGDREGELSQYLVLGVTPGRESGPDRACLPLEGATTTTTLPDLADEPVVAGLPDDGGVLCVVLDVTHTERAGDNVTQTDSTEFDLLLSVDETPAVGVLPEVIDPEPTTPENPTDSGDGTTDGGGTTGGDGTTDGDGTAVLGTRYGPPVTPGQVSDGIVLGLPRTGLDAASALGVGLVLLGVGGAVLAGSRRLRGTSGGNR